MKITDEIEKDWIAALRSGEYTQCTGVLQERDPAMPLSYCCLGVLGKVLQQKGLGDPDINRGDIPYELAISRYGIKHHLVDWNDGDKCDFATIADRIEKKQTDVRYPDGEPRGIA